MFEISQIQLGFGFLKKEMTFLAYSVSFKTIHAIFFFLKMTI